MSNALKVDLKYRGGVFTVGDNKIQLGSRILSKLSDKGVLQKDIAEIAQLVRDQISSNIARAKRYDTKGNVVKLARSTIKQKGFSRPLVNTGKMLLGVIVAKEGSNYIIRMSKDKYPVIKSKRKKSYTLGDRKLPRKPSAAPTVAQVAEWVNDGTKTMPSRPFFGINKTDATKFVNTVLKDRLFKK
jgi:hypothetical protein